MLVVTFTRMCRVKDVIEVIDGLVDYEYKDTYHVKFCGLALVNKSRHNLPVYEAKLIKDF